ncbi:unnamed protein product [Camellia sinensis]
MAQLTLSFILLFCFFFVLNRTGPIVDAQVTTPAKFDGFVYKNRPVSIDSIMIEAFFDPVCPDSRDSWPPLKQALDFYGPRVSLIVHPFALPYHDNAFVSSRALHIINKLNTSATYDLLELFFKQQETLALRKRGMLFSTPREGYIQGSLHHLFGAHTSERRTSKCSLSAVNVVASQKRYIGEEFYNQQTFNMSRASIVQHIVKLATKAVGNSYHSAVESGFTDRKTDLMTRVSFKYGCSRGVFGTPFFFVNGFALPTAGPTLDYSQWRGLIDPLITKHEEGEERIHFV